MRAPYTLASLPARLMAPDAPEHEPEHEEREGQAGPHRQRMAVYRMEGLRYPLRLTAAGMAAAAKTLAGAPVNYEHRPHAGERLFDDAPHPLQGAVISASVEADEAGPVMVAELAIQPDSRVTGEQGMGLVPRASLEFLGAIESARCSLCGAVWFEGRSPDDYLMQCPGCDCVVGMLRQGERCYIDYDDADGVGVAITYCPASRGTGPSEAEAQMSAASPLEAAFLSQWRYQSMFGRPKTPPAPAPAEPEVAVAASDDVAALAAERDALRAQLAGYEAERARQAEASRQAETQRLDRENHEAIGRLMASGRCADGPRALALRAQAPEAFDAIMGLVPAAPAMGTGQLAIPDAPPETAERDPRAIAADIEARARKLASEKSIPLHQATLQVYQELRA